jgi:dolichyl-phosphate-mannose-protein mannosyltransferase
MRQLPAIVVAALVIRLALAPFGQFEGDVNFAREWGDQLAEGGPGSFYDITAADHLPGDLWVFWGLGEAVDLGSHASAFGTETAVLAVKLVPILSDLAIVALLFSIGRRIAGERAGLVAAALYALNPASIFLASIWGQWDSLSAAFALLAVWLYLRGWALWSLPAITYAVLIKPQLGAIALVLLVAAALGPRERRPRLRQVALGAALSAGLLVALTAPFDVPPWPGGETLFDRARFAFERYQEPTVSGFNVWELPSDVLSRDTDSQTLLLGTSYRTAAAVLLLAAFAAILVRLASLPRSDRLLWACLGVTMALFVLPTRVHERWILPAVVFAAVVAACDRRYRTVALLLGLSAFVNVFWVYDLRQPAPDILLISDGNGAAPLVFALLNLGLLAYILVWPTRPEHDSSLRRAPART